MIEAAVDRGIREMQEDPKRSVRKLADLGRQQRPRTAKRMG